MVDLGPEAAQKLLEKDPSGVFLAVVKDFLKAERNGKSGGEKGDKEDKGSRRADFECATRAGRKATSQTRAPFGSSGLLLAGRKDCRKMTQ